MAFQSISQYTAPISILSTYEVSIWTGWPATIFKQMKETKYALGSPGVKSHAMDERVSSAIYNSWAIPGTSIDLFVYRRNIGDVELHVPQPAPAIISRSGLIAPVSTI